MKKLIITLTVYLLFTTPHLHAQSWQWVTQNSWGHMGLAYTTDPDVATDAFGNVYVVGSFTSPFIVFGAYAVVNSGNWYWMYLAKYDSSGNVLWLRGMGGGIGTTDYIEPSAIVTDATGNVYITGKTQDSVITFGTITLHKAPTAFYVGMFLAKYDADGNPVWARTIGGKGGGGGDALAIDKKGNIFISGRTTDSVIFSGITALSAHPSTGFIAKYDSSGNGIWAKLISCDSYFVNVVALSADDSGNTIIAGYTQSDTLYFGTTNLPIPGSIGYNHLFIAKYDSVGNLLWSKSAGGNSNDIVSGITNDVKGNIYVVGRSFSSTLIFDTCTLMHPRWFYIKLNTAGQVLWTKSCNNSGPNSFTKDTSGNIYIAGNYVDSFIIDTDTVITGHSIYSTQGVIVIKSDTSGNIRWVKIASNGITGSISSDNYGSIYIAGHYSGTNIEFGGMILANPDSDYFNVFLAKLDTAYTLGEKNMDMQQKNLLIYPNPTNGLFTIDIPPFKNNAIITICNTLGKTVENRIITENNIGKMEFNLSNYPCGIYIINITADKVLYKNKVIIK